MESFTGMKLLQQSSCSKNILKFEEKHLWWGCFWVKLQDRDNIAGFFLRIEQNISEKIFYRIFLTNCFSSKEGSNLDLESN